MLVHVFGKQIKEIIHTVENLRNLVEEYNKGNAGRHIINIGISPSIHCQTIDWHDDGYAQILMQDVPDTDAPIERTAYDDTEYKIKESVTINGVEMLALKREDESEVKSA